MAVDYHGQQLVKRLIVIMCGTCLVGNDGAGPCPEVCSPAYIIIIGLIGSLMCWFEYEIL